MRGGRESERDREQGRRRAVATELMLLVGARLLARFRGDGAFTAAFDQLSPLLAEIDTELNDDEHLMTDEDRWIDAPKADFKVLVSDPAADAIRIGCHYDSQSISGRLRFDGVFDEQLFGFGVSFDDPESRVELSSEEEEVMQRAFERMSTSRNHGRGRPAFLGMEFQRALAVQPQAGAAIQIHAVELYRDGVVVRHSYDDPVDVEPRLPMHFYDLAGADPPIEEMLAEARAAGGTLAPNVSLSDDVGTNYRTSGVSEGGVQVVHGQSRFTPGVPAEAKRLVVATYAGTITVDL